MSVAAIDIGTNSVLLLIAERRAGELVALVERATITRLGQGVDATRALSPDAVERTLACLARYGEEIRSLGVTRVEAVGTSAMRDATGGEAFVERARELIGVTPRVILGDEEASLTFAGALTGLDLPGAGGRIVFDVGGGSTEIIVGRAAGGMDLAVSLDVGSVRLTERHIHHDPPTATEIEAVRADARAALSTVQAAPMPAASLVGVAGTVTTLAALARNVAPYEGTHVHGIRMSGTEIKELTSRLAALPLADRRQLRALDPARADVIVAGGVLIEEILAWASTMIGAPTDLIVSDRGLRWGLAARLCPA